jgi:hypothetical protein
VVAWTLETLFITVVAMHLLRRLPVVFVSIGVVACTALLGDFDVGSGVSQGDGGGVEAGTLAITPAETKIGILRSQAFTATQDVTWSVQEGEAAGTIDETGRFVSGPTPGTYHVIATSKSSPSRTATVPVIVVNLAVSVMVGPNGGRGNIDGPPKLAHFNSPQSVARFYDPGVGGEQFFIADTGNHTIRHFVGNDLSGQVTTFAGVAGAFGTTNGTGEAARFNGPSIVLAHGAKKKLYIADNRGTCIRVADITSHQVSTLAGTCGTAGTDNGTPGPTPIPAQLQSVSAMIFSSNAKQQDALYVCDSGTLRRIEISAPTAIGVAGPVLNGAVNCNALTMDYAERIYYANGSQVHRFQEPSTFPPAVDPVPESLGDAPNGEWLEGIGIYNNNGIHVFAGTQRSVIYRIPNVHQAGPWSFDPQPYAGVLDDQRVIDGPLATARFGDTSHLASSDQYGDVLIPDNRAHAIRRIASRDGLIVESFIGAALLSDRVDGPRQNARMTGPFTAAADETGNVYLGDITFDGDILNSTIRKYDPVAAVLTTLSGIPTRPFDVSTPPVDGPADQARFWFPVAMTYLKGKLYVIDNMAQGVRAVDVASGAVTTIAGELGVPGNSDGAGAAAHFQFVPTYGSGSGAIFFFGGGVTTDGTFLYVADTWNFMIRKISIATGETTTIAGGTQGTANGTGAAAQFVMPVSATYYDGALYIADWQDHTIRRMNLETGAVDGFIGLSGQAGNVDGDAATATLNSPFRIAADGLGNLYVSELPITSEGQPSGLIRRIDIAKRTIGPFAGTPGRVGLMPGQIPSTLNCPTSLTVTTNNDLVFGDFCETSIGIFKPL